MRPKTTRLTILLAAVISMPGVAQAAFFGEQSRNSLYEMVHTDGRIYKHDRTYKRVDTDTYANTKTVRTKLGSGGVRFYLSTNNNSIVRLGATNDTISTFATYVPPAGMRAMGHVPCGTRVCVVFQDSCDGHSLIGAYAQGGHVFWSQKEWNNGYCFRDAIVMNDTIYELRQAPQAHPQPFTVFVNRYTTGLLALGGFSLGRYDGVAQSIAPHRFDSGSFFVLETDYFRKSTIRRISSSNGSVIASTVFDKPGFPTHAIGYYGVNRELILSGSSSGQYFLASFDDSFLSFKREAVFSYTAP